MSEWKETKLKEFLRVSSGEGLPDSKMKPGQFPVYGGNGITGFHNEFLFLESRLIIGRVGALCGNVHVTQKKSWITDNALIVSFVDNNPAISFWYYLLSNLNLREYAFQSAQPVITGGIIDKIQIKIPVSPSDRNFIAQILITCDAVIEQTQSAIAKYKAIKQGLLHDLFTRGLDANGKLRPRFQDAPELYKESELGMIPKEWEVKRLGELTTKIGDGIHTTPLYVESSDYQFINGNNLVNGHIQITNRTNRVSFEEYNKYKIDLNGKSILMSINGTIGNLAYYKNEKVILGKSAAYICCGNEVDVGYVYSFLGTTILLKYFSDELTGSTIQNLSLASIRNAPILFPKREEQKSIVKILNNYNNKLNSEETLLQKYRSIKRGLMGDLLGGKKPLA